MNADELSRTIDRGENNENDFKIILECLIANQSATHTLIDLIVDLHSKNEQMQDQYIAWVDKTMAENREKIIAHLYSNYGYIPPEILEP